MMIKGDGRISGYTIAIYRFKGINKNKSDNI